MINKYKHVVYIAISVLGLGIASLSVAPVANALQCGVLPQDICNAAENQPGGTGGDIKNTGVGMLLMTAVRIFSAGVAVLATGGIIYGALMYTSAGGSPEGVKKAKTILTNVVIGVAAYALMYGLLEWLIPGGAFN